MLLVATGVGGCGWTISPMDICMNVAFWKFSKHPPNYASLDDAMKFLMILHSKCTGLFYRGIAVIGVLLLDFERRKNIYLICCMPLVLICRMHMNLNEG